VNVNGTGAANAQSIHVHETGYLGPFSESNDCTGKATFSTSNANGQDSTWTVTGVQGVTCTATFSDAFNQHTTTQINVTTTPFQISTKKR
jgi:hypothetical protein